MSKIINEALEAYTAKLPCREIIIDEQVYLRRYFVNIDWAWQQTWLHQILLPDTNRALHSHPWFAESRVISGGYNEERLKSDGTRDFNHLRVGDFNIIEPGTLHKIVEVKKYTWTELRVAPGRAPQWYFINEDGTREAVETNDEHWYLNALTRDRNKPLVNVNG